MTQHRTQWLSVGEARDALAQGGGAGIRIAVFDSGIEVDHPRLSSLTLTDDLHVVDDGVQIAVRSGDGSDIFGHGTAVADIIRQTAPACSIGSIRVLGERLNSRTVIIREGVRQALDRGYQILNCSFGCGVKDHIFQYKDWVDEAYLKGVHVIAACNNFDLRTVEWPGFFPTVVTVNMARGTDDWQFFYKPGQLVEFAARGVGLSLAWRQHQVREVTGSSFAAPRIAGMLARLLSVYPRVHPLEAKALLLEIAEDWTPEHGASNVVYSE